MVLRFLALVFALMIYASSTLAANSNSQQQYAPTVNPFQKDSSKLLQELNEQKKQQYNQPADGTTPPTQPTATQGSLPFDVSPELLRQLQPTQEPDYTTHFTNMSVIAINGMQALMRSNDYYYYVKDGGSFTHDGLRFFVEINDNDVHVLSPLGTEIYVGSVGSGPKVPDVEKEEENQKK